MADDSQALYHIVGRALSDAEFRETLRSAPYRDDELGKMGISLTAEQSEQLEAALNAVDALAERFGAPQAAT